MALVVWSASAQAIEILELAGSTTVEKRLLEPTVVAMEEAIGVRVQVRGVNSGRGFEELKDGKIHASISSAPLASLLKAARMDGDTSFQEHVITVDRIVPIVHLENPVNTLTHQQLSDIHTGKVTNWKDVGGLDQAVQVITSQKSAATRIMFQQLVMNDAEYVVGAREVKSTRAEIHMVRNIKGGNGAVSESFIKMRPGSVKILATQEISRPLSFITKGAPAPLVQKAIDYLRFHVTKH